MRFLRGYLSTSVIPVFGKDLPWSPVFIMCFYSKKANSSTNWHGNKRPPVIPGERASKPYFKYSGKHGQGLSSQPLWESLALLPVWEQGIEYFVSSSSLDAHKKESLLLLITIRQILSLVYSLFLIPCLSSKIINAYSIITDYVIRDVLRLYSSNTNCYK